jgi:hypothetical protein
MNERTWDGVNGKKPSGSAIAAHPSLRHLPDPNNEQNRTAIRHWIRYSDFYEMPHITYYDSVPDLVRRLELLTPADLMLISERMKEFNVRAKSELLKQWRRIMENIAKRSANSPH